MTATAATLRLSVTLDQDVLAYAADHDVDADTLRTELLDEIRAAYPGARVRVLVTDLGPIERHRVQRVNEEGLEDWERGDDLIAEHLAEIEDDVLNRLCGI